jgi:hypothetical protein
MGSLAATCLRTWGGLAHHYCLWQCVLLHDRVGKAHLYQQLVERLLQLPVWCDHSIMTAQDKATTASSTLY